MRKHRLFGVVIAATLGLGAVTQRPAHSTAPSSLGLAQNSSRLASASLPFSTSGATTVMALPSGMLRPAAVPSMDSTATLASLKVPAPPAPTPYVRPYVPIVQAVAATYVQPTAPSGGVWAALRTCESGGNYGDQTGNGYYGAYQFALSTWESLGYSGLPSQAGPDEQDAAAQKLQARSGWHQWPVCSRRLGLG